MATLGSWESQVSTVKPNNKLRCHPHSVWGKKNSDKTNEKNAHVPYTPHFYDRTCRGSLRSTLWVFGSIIHLVSDSKHHSCWNFCGPKIRVSQLAPTVVQNHPIFPEPAPNKNCDSHQESAPCPSISPSTPIGESCNWFANSEPREDALLLLHTPSVISPWCPSL